MQPASSPLVFSQSFVLGQARLCLRLEPFVGNFSPLPTDFPGGSEGKASAYNGGDLGWISGLGRSSEEGSGNPLQYSCLENPTDR